MVRMHEMTWKKNEQTKKWLTKENGTKPQVPRGMGSRSYKSPMNRFILRKILKNADKKNDYKLPIEYYINYSTFQIHFKELWVTLSYFRVTSTFQYKNAFKDFNFVYKQIDRTMEIDCKLSNEYDIN